MAYRSGRHRNLAHPALSEALGTFDRRLHSQSLDRFANIFHRHVARDVRRTDLRRYDEANFSGFEFFVELYCLEDLLAREIPRQPCG